jgi:soluble lytic murein transglycosylase-like protein
MTSRTIASGRHARQHATTPRRGLRRTAMLALGVPATMMLATGAGSSALDTDEVPDRYVDIVEQAGEECNLAPSVFAAQIETESAWDPDAVSSTGAQGLAQFMPATWEEWGKDYDGNGDASPFDPADAIGTQADYLCHLQDWAEDERAAGVIEGDRLDLALAAYNAGQGNVRKHGGIPPFEETVNYIQRFDDVRPSYTEN